MTLGACVTYRMMLKPWWGFFSDIILIVRRYPKCIWVHLGKFNFDWSPLEGDALFPCLAHEWLQGLLGWFKWIRPSKVTTYFHALWYRGKFIQRSVGIIFKPSTFAKGFVQILIFSGKGFGSGIRGKLWKKKHRWIKFEFWYPELGKASDCS